MLSRPEVPHLTSTPHGMQAGFTVRDSWRHQLQQVLLIQTGQQGGDIPVQTEAQLYREESGGTISRLFDQ